MNKLIFGILGAVALMGCGGSGGNGGGSNSTTARIAYVNASPDAGDLDFYVNDSRKASAVPFGSLSSFDSVDPKDYDVSIRPSGGSEILWSEARGFTADTDNVVVALGLRTPPSDDTQVPPVPELDKRLVLAFAELSRETPTGNRSRLLLVNAFVRKEGFSTPAIDFRNPGDTPVIDSQNLAFGATRSLDVDSGDQTFQVRQNGTEQVFVERAFSGANTLRAGGVYIALISGQEDVAPDIRLIPVTTRD